MLPFEIITTVWEAGDAKRYDALLTSRLSHARMPRYALQEPAGRAAGLPGEGFLTRSLGAPYVPRHR